jgi:hypothetical protein
MSTRSRGHEEPRGERAASRMDADSGRLWPHLGWGPNPRGGHRQDAPAVWYERCEALPALPFAGYFADPSENPTVRPQPAPPRRDHEPVALEDGLVVIARRRRP